MYDDEEIIMIIEEILFDGAINLGNVRRSTAYRIKNKINYILERDNCDWRVKLRIDKTERLPYSLIAIDKEK